MDELDSLNEKLLKQGFYKCVDGKELSLQELEEFLRTEDALLTERGLIIHDLYLRVAVQSDPMKYIAYLRPDYP